MGWLRKSKPDKPKEETKMPEAQTTIFDPREYGNLSRPGLTFSRFTPDEIDELLTTTTPQEYDRTFGRIKYQRDLRLAEEDAKAAAEAAEKAKIEWAMVHTYQDAYIEAEALPLHRVLQRLNGPITPTDYTLIPLKRWKEGTVMVKLKDIQTVHYTEEFTKMMDGGVSVEPDTDNCDN